ncbi:hypothetical protein IEU_05361 [Bacillus mycoides]|nr:hypothetical protein IEW_05467 [Bacillus mycoides]EJQ57965.1 hypothetical protein IEY_05461 [Bacillus mycoides]EJV60787.1 hypothetical protein IEU_05361 [Bacillus mycoides]
MKVKKENKGVWSIPGYVDESKYKLNRKNAAA